MFYLIQFRYLLLLIEIYDDTSLEVLYNYSPFFVPRLSYVSHDEK